MHLLNTLPQRLDPGATPTFAGLIAPSLTSPAATNLTLGLGTGGTALTLASSTLAATFAGVVVVPDGSAAAPSLVVSSSPTTGFYRHGSGAIGFSSAGLACAAFSSNTGGGGLYLEALGTNQNIRLVPSGTGILTTAAPVTFTNTTAGASNVGALVVTGGLATGAASYFGGQVTAARPFMSTGAIQANMTSAGGFGFAGGGTNFYSFGANSATSGSFAFQSISSDASVNFNALTLAAGTGAATFAGAVTVGGKITSAVSTATGYNQLYDTSGITTGRGAFAITSTGAALAFGIEASVGGTSFTGSAAYSSYFGTTNATPVYLVTNGVIRQTIDSTGAATFAGAVSVSGTAATWTSGTGSPESVKTAPVGSLYTRTDGGASTTLYVKESGAGNTGWIAK